MRYATIRTEYGTTAARVDGDLLVPLAAGDVGEMLAGGADGLELTREGAQPVPVAEADFAPLVTRPGKVICVGLNYRAHILETGREAPEYPTLFAKFADTLLGPRDDLVIPSISDRVDWEVELGHVIGRPVYRATTDEAEAAIAEYRVFNDGSGPTCSPRASSGPRRTLRSGARSTAWSCSSRGPRTCCSARRRSSPTRARLSPCGPATYS